MQRLHKLLFLLQAVGVDTLAWLQSTDLGNAVLVVLVVLVFGLLGIMSLRVFAPR